MKPTLQSSDQVVAHVVAWHNRNPLALRITPDQVHSVGVVSLPYAVRGARAQPVLVDDPTAPAVAAELSPAPASPIDPLAEPAAESAPPDLGTEVALEASVELEFETPDALETPAAAEATEPTAPPHEATPEAVREAAKEAAEPVPATPHATPPRLPQRPVDLPPRPPAWHPLTWWAGARGRLPFHALFSEDFIAPLRPRQVRPWVARHGVGLRPLEPQAPHRLIMLDAALRQPGGDATEVDLHVITAAIGQQDGRHRLLLSPDGVVLGRRLWSRPRLATAAGSAAAVLALVGGGWVWKASAGSAALLTQQSASAVSAASAPKAAVQAASTPAPVIAAASAAPAQASAAVSSAHTDAHARAHAPAEAPSAPAPPPNVSPRRGRVDLPTLVPPMADSDRQQARSSSRELRKEPDQPAVRPDAKAWALVTLPLQDRRQSERVAAQLHAVALLQPVPMRAELMPAGKGWRAVFWPFPSAQDAEKVRLALADKGLRTEVLEF